MTQDTATLPPPALYRTRTFPLPIRLTLVLVGGYRLWRKRRRTAIAVARLDPHLRRDIGLPPIDPWEDNGMRWDRMLRHR